MRRKRKIDPRDARRVIPLRVILRIEGRWRITSERFQATKAGMTEAVKYGKVAGSESFLVVFMHSRTLQWTVVFRQHADGPVGLSVADVSPYPALPSFPSASSSGPPP